MCIKGRVSVRKFRNEPIPDMVMDEILDAAIAAPSAGNCQSWEFVVVGEKENENCLPGPP